MKRRVYRAGAILALIAAVAAIAVVLTENVLHSVIVQQADRWSDMLRLAVSAAGGYLFGSIPFGFIVIGVLRERDITEEGSGRTGGTNAFRAGGFGAGALTVIGDLLKGLAGVTLARLVFAGNLWAEVFAGWGVILGHNASIYLAFRGGAGTAPNMGVAARPLVPFIDLHTAVLSHRHVCHSHRVVDLAGGGPGHRGDFCRARAVGARPVGVCGLRTWRVVLSGVCAAANIKRLLNGTESWVDLRAQEKEKRKAGTQ